MPLVGSTDAATAQAVRFWARRHSGAWTLEDEQTLAAWLDAAPNNRSAYARVAQVWAVAGSVSRAERFGFFRSSLVPRRVWVGAALAATAAVALVLVVRVGTVAPAGRVTIVRAEVGQRRDLVLADGSQVTLDAGSEIETQFGPGIRRVVLRKGEISIDVAARNGPRFEVMAGRGRIVDVGTRFDIETLQGRVRIDVVDGRVAVATAHGETVIDQGHAGGYGADGTIMPIVRSSPAAQLWKSGLRKFEDEPLRDVLERLSRYHGVSITFDDATLGNLQVSGTFKLSDLDVFLGTLAQALPVEVHRVDSTHVRIAARARR